MVSTPRARRALWLLVIAGLMPAWSTAAQHPAPTPSTFERSTTSVLHASPELARALRQVWQRSPALQAAESRLAAGHAREQAAGQPLYNPEIEIGAENADVDTRSIGISQTLDWRGKRRARTDIAASETRAAEAQREQQRQRIGLDWLAAFASFRVASERVELGAQRVGLLERFAALAQRRFNVGDIAQLERDLAELALQEAHAQQAELVAEQAKARQSIVAIGGGDTDLPDLPRALPPAAELSPATSVEMLPSLREAAADVDTARARVVAAERERRPDPTLSLFGGRVSNGPLSDKVIGLNLRIPLFVRNSHGAEVAAALASVDEADALLRDGRQRASAQIEQAAAGYNALRAAWLAWQQSSAANASDRAALLQRLWEAGEIGTTDYLVQLKQSLDTELTATGLRARAWQAFADWLAASGGLDRWLGDAAEAAQP